MRLMATVLVSGLIVQTAHAQPPPLAAHANAANHFSCVKDPSWTAPQKPIRIYGNTWYVGPRGLTVLLIISPSGDALIDGGVPGYASLIEANIRDLGVSPRDIKW